MCQANAGFDCGGEVFVCERGFAQHIAGAAPDLHAAESRRRFEVRVDTHVHNCELHIVQPSQHIDCRAASYEVEHHLGRNFSRIGADSFRCHAVIGGKYINGAPHRKGDTAGEDREHLRCNVLQSSQAADWFGQAVEPELGFDGVTWIDRLDARNNAGKRWKKKLIHEACSIRSRIRCCNLGR